MQKGVVQTAFASGSPFGAKAIRI